jgi:hypothetical protein
VDDLLNAFPAMLRAEAETPVRLLMTQIRPMDFQPDRKADYFFDVRLGGDVVSIPQRLYDHGPGKSLLRNPPLQSYLDIAATLPERQASIYFSLLTRHHNGFIREEALCRIASTQEPFIAPFVAQLASEYVYEILLQIWLRLDQLSPAVYGPLFRNNPTWLSTLRQRMISYWNCYYRWRDYTSVDGGTHRSWRDPYIGFAVFDAFKNMAENYV